MITPDEAETLANRLVSNYVKECKPSTPEDVANALEKLASVTGLNMCVVVGQNDSIHRLRHVVEHIAKPKHAYLNQSPGVTH